MRCIFCKHNSADSISVEHIIPASLGNKSHILPKGVVCDKCNNYFALKIEKKVLELKYFKSLRSRNEILNKKGKLPPLPAYIPNVKNEEIEICYDPKSNDVQINITDRKVLDLIKQGKIKKIYIPIINMPPENDHFISRLICKIALEALALRVISIDNWNEDFVENTSLDPLRNFVRFGTGHKIWDYHQRRIYNELDTFSDLSSENKPERYQVLHEFDFLMTNSPDLVSNDLYSISNLFFVCAIMGIEYSINLSGSVQNYLKWIKLNQGVSPLTRDYQIRQKKF